MWLVLICYTTLTYIIFDLGLCTLRAILPKPCTWAFDKIYHIPLGPQPTAINIKNQTI